MDYNKAKFRKTRGVWPGILADCPWLPVRADLSKEEMIRWSHLTQGTPQPPNHPSPIQARLPTIPANNHQPPWHHVEPLRIQFRLALSCQSWQLDPLLGRTEIWNVSAWTHSSHAPSRSRPSPAGRQQFKVNWEWVETGEGWAEGGAAWAAWAHTRKRSQRRSGRLLVLAALSSQLVWETWWESWLAGCRAPGAHMM